jgi:hypothetical protein
MTLAFIVRVEFDGQRWALTLQDLATGERCAFDGFDACCAALRERAVARAHPSLRAPAGSRGRRAR